MSRALLRADAYCQNFTDCPFRSQGHVSLLKVSNRLKIPGAFADTVCQVYHEVLNMAQQVPLNISACAKSKQCISPVTAALVAQGASDVLGGIQTFRDSLAALLWLSRATPVCWLKPR